MYLAIPGPTSKGSTAKFSGDVYLNPLLSGESPSRLVSAMVRFAPGSHTHWHSHPLGQTLHCTDGMGLVVNRAGEVILMRAGDTVHTPPGEEHWHGATRDSLMCHLALVERLEGQTATWLEPVTEHDYQAAHTDIHRQSTTNTAKETP